MKNERDTITGIAGRRRGRTTLHAQRTAAQEDLGEKDLAALLQEGQNTTDRVLLHSCLLKRRLQLGADPADLLQIVHAIQFAVEDLQVLFRSAVQAVTPACNPVPTTAEATVVSEPPHPEVIDLYSLLTRCVDSVRQRAQRRGVPLLCNIAPDLPQLTADPEKLAQVVSLLLEHAVAASDKDGLEVHVRWAEEALVIDVHDAGRGISTETYVVLHHLVGSLHGTLVVTRELGMRSRVALSFPSEPARGNGAPQIAPIPRTENR